eukprot:s872_g13.t1
MAGAEPFPPTPPSGALDMEEPERLDEIRESLRKSPKPTVAQVYDLSESEFWRQRYIPVGSVIVFSAGFIEESQAGDCALLVKDVEDTREGMWLTVKCLGAEVKEFQNQFVKHFKKGKVKVHLCYGETVNCPEFSTEGVHLDKFTWFPPGDYNAKWLSSAARKAIRDGKTSALAEAEADARGEPSRTAFTTLEDRLSRLKERAGRRVTFAGDLEPRAGAPGEGDVRTRRVGTGTLGQLRSPGRSALEDMRRQVKTEPINIESDHEDSQKRRRRKKRESQSVEDRLARAVRERSDRDVKKEKKRSRSRSSRRRRRSRRRKRRRSDSRSDSEESRSTSQSSSGDSLVPPLKKKAQKSPGSVFKLLESQAVDQLAQEGVLEEEYMTESRRPKMYTYFQLALRPRLDVKSRDCREISLIAKCLDMLREGRLANLADVLAARLLAVETATRQGWATAKHLEVFLPDEEGAVPPHLLLAAQRHQRQVEKAGGKGSWPRPGGYGWSEGPQEPRNKGKGKEGKGKGKKGKGKNKNKSGADYKNEGEGKPKAPES